MKKENNLIICLAFLFLSVLIYFNSLHGDFILDDGRIIVNNVFITSFKYIPLYFKGKITSASPGQILFRPLWMLSYNINYLIGKYQVWVYRIFNVLLQGWNGFLLYLLFCQLFPRVNNKIKILTAGIFVVHPVNTEAVNYISARSDILCATFILASLLYFFKWERGGCRRYLYYSYLFMLLGCLTKEFAFALPVFLVAYTFITRNWKKYNLYVLPCLLITVIFFFAYWLVVGRKSGWNDPVYFYRNFLVQSKVALLYLKLFLFPSGLTIVHEIKPLSSWGGLISLGVVIVTFLLAYRYSSSRFLMGLVFFIIFMLPKLVKLNLPGMEHHFYIPEIGICISLCSIVNKWDIQKTLPLLLTVVIIFSIGSIFRNRTWRKGENIWLDALGKNPDSDYVLISLGLKYLRDNKEDLAKRYLFTAMQKCKQPKRWLLIVKGIAEIYRREGNLNKAEQILYSSRRIFPNDFGLVHNLGVIYAQKGEYKNAERCYISALKINPYYLKSIFNMGLLYLREGKIIEAKRYLQRCIKLNPGFVRSYFYLGLIAEQEKNIPQAIFWYAKAIEVDPGYWGGYLGLGSIYLHLRDSRAKFYLQKVVELNPDIPEGWYNLGIFYLYQCNDLVAARKYLHKAHSLGYKIPESISQYLTNHDR